MFTNQVWVVRYATQSLIQHNIILPGDEFWLEPAECSGGTAVYTVRFDEEKMRPHWTDVRLVETGSVPYPYIGPNSLPTRIPSPLRGAGVRRDDIRVSAWNGDYASHIFEHKMQRFVDECGREGLNLRFMFSGPEVLDEHFRTRDAEFADAVDLAWYTGHAMDIARSSSLSVRPHRCARHIGRKLTEILAASAEHAESCWRTDHRYGIRRGSCPSAHRSGCRRAQRVRDGLGKRNEWRRTPRIALRCACGWRKGGSGIALACAGPLCIRVDICRL
jgi:hypothetical protein